MIHKVSKPIKTNRLTLRPLCLSDANDMIEYWVSDIDVTKYLTWQAYSDIKKAKEFIKKYTKANKKLDSYKWGIKLNEFNKVIGSIDVVALSQSHQAA